MSLGMKMLKLFFRAYLGEKWIDFHQINTKMTLGSFCTYHRIHFTSTNV